MPQSTSCPAGSARLFASLPTLPFAQRELDAARELLGASPSDELLNAAFTDLQLDRNQSAADRMEALVRQAPPDNRVLLSTAYVTWGAA